MLKSLEDYRRRWHSACTVDARLQRGDPVAHIASLECVIAPVVARHDTATGRSAARAGHPEARRAGLGPVVDRRFLPGDDVSSGRQRVRPVMPEARVAAVVAEVCGCPWWKHEVLVGIDRDRVDERRLGIGICLSDESVEVLGGDQPSAQLRDDCAGRDVVGEEESLTLDGRCLDPQPGIDPDL